MAHHRNKTVVKSTPDSSKDGSKVYSTKKKLQRYRSLSSTGDADSSKVRLLH
jgi:hypothetical protein